MEDLQTLIERANQKLEINDFGGAVNDYRSGAMMSPPSQTILDNLRISEQEETLQFRRRLSIHYPESYAVQVALGDHYAKFHYKRQAIELYTSIMNTLEIDVHQETGVRLRRFRAICDEGCYSHTLFLEDFWKIWKFGDQYEPAKKLRIIMLRSIAEGATDEYAIKSLKTLMDSDDLPLSVKSFIETKINEIHMLKEIQSTFNP